MTGPNAGAAACMMPSTPVMMGLRPLKIPWICGAIVLNTSVSCGPIVLSSAGTWASTAEMAGISGWPRLGEHGLRVGADRS